MSVSKIVALKNEVLKPKFFHRIERICLTSSCVLIVSTNEMTDWMLGAKSLTQKCVSYARVLRRTGHAEEKRCLTPLLKWKN